MNDHTTILIHFLHRYFEGVNLEDRKLRGRIVQMMAQNAQMTNALYVFVLVGSEERKDWLTASLTRKWTKRLRSVVYLAGLSRSFVKQGRY